MAKVIEILIALVMLSIIICIHELGHFLLAKINGVTVTEFSLGMGPRLLSKKYKGTRYSLKLLPFGGSCMMLGEGEESDAEGSFGTKSVWKRFAIVLAGPLFNFILAFILSFVILISIGYDPCLVYSVDDSIAASGLREDDIITEYQGHKIRFGRELSLYETLDGIGSKDIHITYLRDGKKYKTVYSPVYEQRYYLGIYYSSNGTLEGNGPLTLTDVIKGGAAEKAGLKKDDRIISVNGTRIETVADFDDYTAEHPLTDTEMIIGFLRNGKELETRLTPKFSESYKLGFDYNVNYREKIGVGKAIVYGANEVEYWIKSVFKSLSYMLHGKASREDIGGAVRVVDEMSNVIDESFKTDGLFYAFLNLLNWSVLLSANLGVMNLLPIPALDGGRLFIYIIEMIRGKKMKPEHEGIINLVGFVLLMILMVFVLFNDLVNIFH